MNVFSKDIRFNTAMHDFGWIINHHSVSAISKSKNSVSLRFKSRIADDFEASLAEISHYKNDNIQWYCGSNIAMRYATYFQRVQRGIAR